MIAVDTNVLIRFIVADDERQTARVSALMRAAVERGKSLFLSDVVLCETVWVLERSYEFSRAEISSTLRQLLSARQLVFSDTQSVERAFTAYASGRGGFADYVILEHARNAGCSSVVTFDRILSRERGFESP